MELKLNRTHCELNVFIIGEGGRGEGDEGRRKGWEKWKEDENMGAGRMKGGGRVGRREGRRAIQGGTEKME